MNFVLKYSSIINAPIWFVYYVFPLISIVGRLLGHRINYEPFWILLFLLFPVLSVKTRIKEKKIIFIALFIWIVILKYLIPFIFNTESLIIKPYFIELKWIIYIFLAIGWTTFVGIPDKQRIYNGGKFFAYIYIIYNIFKIIYTGNYERVIILDEANYDGFLLLIPFCFIFENKINKIDFFVFFIATILTGSRTGCMAFLVITLYYKFRNHLFLILLSVPILLLFLLLILYLRNTNSIENIDRFIFFYQAYIYFQSTSWYNVLFGIPPGTQLDIYVIPQFEWYVNHFNNINNIVGVYPFYFHSAYIRLAMIWGIPSIIVLMFILTYRFFSCKYIPLRMLILLILLQSISLATHSLTNVSFIIFITYIIMVKQSNRINKYAKKNSLHILPKTTAINK